MAAAPLQFLLSPSLGEVKEHVRAEFFGRALTQRLGRPVRVGLAPSYEVLERELAGGHVDLVWGTAEQCTAYEKRSRAVLRAVRAGLWYYYAALICRADEPLALSTLRARAPRGWPQRSTGGYLLPTRHLLGHGVLPQSTFREQRFWGTYRKTLLAVLEREADLTAIYTTHPEENTVRAYLAEHVGGAERRLLPFAFTERHALRRPHPHRAPVRGGRGADRVRAHVARRGGGGVGSDAGPLRQRGLRAVVHAAPRPAPPPAARATRSTSAWTWTRGSGA